MVRLDKIIYMITCFKSSTDDLEQSQYSSPKENISLDNSTLMVLRRMGVISGEEKSDNIRKTFLDSIPFGRENFFLFNIKEHYKEICKESSPICSICMMNIQCDYNNKKNYWKESF